MAGNQIELKTKTIKEYKYTQGESTLDFTLNINYKVQLEGYRDMLTRAARDVQRDIDNLQIGGVVQDDLTMWQRILYVFFNR